MKDRTANDIALPRRRQLLTAGSLGLAVMLAGRRAIAASAAAVTDAARLQGRVLGLTTRGPGKDPYGGDTSELLHLDLASGDAQLATLGDYSLGHSLLTLPGGAFFAVPYGVEDNPCLFLDKDFAITGEVFAPADHGFGGHAVLLPDNKTLFTHFNREEEFRGLSARDTGQLCRIDIASGKVTHVEPSGILHGHDMILSRDGKTVILADDGYIETPVPDFHPYGVISYKPALYLFDAVTLAPTQTIDLPINGSLVHIEEGTDHRIYGGTEQFVPRNDIGREILENTIGDETDAYLASVTEAQYREEVPLPGPLIGVDVDSGDVSSTVSVEQSDPFDIRLNQDTGLLFSVYSTSNQLARLDARQQAWSYFPTAALGIHEPFGLIEIPGTPWMVINGFERGVAVFDAQTMDLVRYYDIPTYGMKHMLFSG